MATPITNKWSFGSQDSQKFQLLSPEPLAFDAAKASTLFKLTCMVAGCVQSALMGGVIFGISSISDSFLLQSTPVGGPELSAPYIYAMYVLGTFFAALAPIGSGLVLESGGPRLSSCLSTALFALGCFMFALSDSETCMYLPAVCLLALAGPGVHAATMHVPNLFRESRGVATVCLTASFHASFGCLYVVQRLYEAGWDYRQIFRAYGCLALASLLVSLVLWPGQGAFISRACFPHYYCSSASLALTSIPHPYRLRPSPAPNHTPPRRLVRSLRRPHRP